MVRYLGIDYGSKRIGLAIGDSQLRLATPLTTVQAAGTLAGDARLVLEAAHGFDVQAYVVGLPLNMDGTEGAQAELSRRFGEQVGRQGGRPVHYWDERLSSEAARELLVAADLTRKKKKARLDRVAAQVILQEFLDGLATEAADNACGA